MHRYDLKKDAAGLSFAARAAVATIAALTYQTQDSGVPVLLVTECLGLGDEAWASIINELHEAGVAYVTGDAGGPALVMLDSCFDILACAMGAGGRPTESQWRALRSRVFAEHGQMCAYCCTTVGPFEVDHILPVTRGGSNHPDNLVPACKRCNSAKGNKLWEEWYPQIAQLKP